MPDTSHVAELSDNALSYTDVITKHTQLHSPNSPHSRSPHSILQSSSLITGSVSQEQPSSLSSSQMGIHPATAAAAMAREQSESPLLGNFNPMRTPPPKRSTVVSEMSISEHRMSHLRNLSGATVSSTSNAGSSLPSTPPPMQTSFNSGPVSPPLVSSPTPLDDHDAGDYISAHQGITGHYGSSSHAGLSRGPGGSGSLRLSVFRENTDDLGDAPNHSHTQ